MVTEFDFKRIAALEPQAQQFIEQFKHLLSAKQLIQQTNPSKFQTLRLQASNDYLITLEYVGFVLQFKLIYALRHGRTVGRVVCLNCYTAGDENYADMVGSFMFDPAGLTDLPPFENGNAIYMSEGADAIAVHFIDRALREAPQSFPKP